jgi:hypothetical protein
MMNSIFKNVFRFILFAGLQILIFNKIEVGWGIQFMPYPLFLFLLPQTLRIEFLFIIAFIFGLTLDGFSNTYGLHTSALLTFAYLKPIVFKAYAPHEEYDPLLETNIYTLGPIWYFYTFGILMLIHHLWFFVFETLRIDLMFFILLKTILSVIASFVLSLILQYLFVARPKDR